MEMDDIDYKKIILEKKYIENYSDEQILDVFSIEEKSQEVQKNFKVILNELRKKNSKISQINPSIIQNSKDLLEIIISDNSDQNIFENFIQNFEAGFLKAILFFQKLITEKRISIAKLKESKELIVLDVNAVSNTQEIILLPLDPYKIIPDFMNIEFKLNEKLITDESVDDIIVQTSKIKISLYKKPQKKSADQKKDDLILFRLKKMINFFNKEPYAHFTLNNIEDCSVGLKKQCAGFNYYADKIYEEFIGYLTSSIYELPKGILFYGPPRTGKTYCSKMVLELLNMFRIHPDLAAGDFKKPLQGQGEQMINKIADRCDCLPWELCVLFIDEIDGLCPNRKGAGANESSINLISVILSIMDGNKRKNNLLVMGTSNRLKQMDDAFLQRLDIKLFIGLPNTLSRADWIKRVSEKTTDKTILDNKRLHKNYLETILKLLNKTFQKNILGWTLNFTADAMKKSISQIMTKITQKQYLWDAPIREIEDELNDLIYENLTRICSNDKIYISNYPPPVFVRELASLNDEKYNGIPWDILNNGIIKGHGKLTRRALFDFKENPNEFFQFEIERDTSLKSNQIQLINNIYLYLIEENKKPDKADEKDILKVCCIQLYEEFKKIFKSYYDDLNTEFKHYIETLIDIDMKYLEIKSFFLQFVDESLYGKIQKESESNTLYSFGLQNNKYISSKEEALKILTNMGLLSNINYILVLDSAYFIKNNISSDEEMATELIMACEEAIQYDSCLVIIDLDSADLIKSYSNLTQGIPHSTPYGFMGEKNDPNFSYTNNRNNLFRAALEFLSLQGKSDKNHWFVALSSDNKTTLDFKEKLKWPSTNEQKKIERKLQCSHLMHVCEFCGDVYKEKDNEPNACGRHSSKKLYDEDYINKLKNIKKDNNLYDPFEDKEHTQFIYFIREEILDEMKRNPNLKVSKFKWLCCGKSFWEKGEIKKEHRSKGLYNSTE